MAESVNKKLERVRAPRVHISYDVETGGAIEMKELPFVMGVLGDFTGKPAEPLARLKDDVLKSMKPHLSYTVDNVLAEGGEASRLGVDLKFESLDDFSPDRVAQQVDPLRKLLELRQQLADLRGSLQGNEKLDEVLQATLASEEKLKQLKEELESGETNG
jgi:type VI secretion system protein ImpB